MLVLHSFIFKLREKSNVMLILGVWNFNPVVFDPKYYMDSIRKNVFLRIFLLEIKNPDMNYTQEHVLFFVLYKKCY